MKKIGFSEENVSNKGMGRIYFLLSEQFYRELEGRFSGKE